MTNRKAVAEFFEDEASMYDLMNALDRALEKRDAWMRGDSDDFVGTVADQMRLELVQALKEPVA